jgi:hypothetical protein
LSYCVSQMLFTSPAFNQFPPDLAPKQSKLRDGILDTCLFPFRRVAELAPSRDSAYPAGVPTGSAATLSGE